MWRATLALAVAASCVAPVQAPDPAAVFSVPVGLDRHRPIPETNPLAPDKVALGRRLFFDPVLSADRSLACASCHNPARAFTDGRQVGVGVYGRRGHRNVPTLVNRAYGRSFFWDGRAARLEDQVLGPIEDSLELGLAPHEALARLRRDSEYDAEFRKAFDEPPTLRGLSAALASYVRTILSGDSRFDRWMRGESSALTREERFGLDLFRGRASCGSCHLGPNFTDEEFHNTGAALRDGVFSDSGRFLVSHDPRDIGAFKTPTLRDVAHTPPYMHDGSVATLEQVIAFYDGGGKANAFLAPQLRPLKLSPAEQAALVAFLRALSGGKD